MSLWVKIVINNTTLNFVKHIKPELDDTAWRWRCLGSSRRGALPGEIDRTHSTYSRWWLVPRDKEGKRTCSQVPPIQSQCRVSYTMQHKRSLETAIPPQDLFQAKRAEILNFNLKLKFNKPFQQDSWQRAQVEAGGSRSRLGAVLWKICPGFSELPGLQALSLCLVWCRGWAWMRMELRETWVKSLNKPFSTVRADWPVGD